MGHVDRQLELLRNVAKLRAAQRRLPADDELSAVRASLEAELGETVSQRIAARLLGVSHTALQRWIKAGDLALVETPSGRRQIPVGSLLELLDEVSRERERGRRSEHLLEPSLQRGRSRAERLEPGAVAPETADADRAARISLAYHRVLAERLTRKLVAEARHRVNRWENQGRLDSRYAGRWRELLALPLKDLREAIGSADEEARDLRQTSPFAGMLSEPERRRIVEELS